MPSNAAGGGVYLLEVNPGPDFRMTGVALGERVVGGFMGDTVDAALGPRSTRTDGGSRVGGLNLVYERDGGLTSMMTP